ncbi:hypothetical protein OHA20_05135 [Streptomyces sp. NBC_01579]
MPEVHERGGARPEHRYPQHRPGFGKQGSKFKLDTARNEEHRNEESVAEALEFDVELWVGPFGIGVDQSQHGSCNEGAQDGLKS